MRNLLLILAIAFTFFACSENSVVKHNTKGIKSINLSVNEVYAWINYMPGEDSTLLFRISGDIVVKKSSDYNLKDLTLNKLVVYQDTIIVYTIKPVIKENGEQTNPNKRNMLFNLLKGLELSDNLDINKKIDVEFVFEENNKLFTYFINNIGIEKTY